MHVTVSSRAAKPRRRAATPERGCIMTTQENCPPEHHWLGRSPSACRRTPAASPGGGDDLGPDQGGSAVDLSSTLSPTIAPAARRGPDVLAAR